MSNENETTKVTTARFLEPGDTIDRYGEHLMITEITVGMHEAVVTFLGRETPVVYRCTKAITLIPKSMGRHPAGGDV